MYSDMSQPNDGAFVIEQEFRQARASSVLPNAGWPKKQERANGPFRIAQSRTAAANRISDARKCRVLPYHALAQPLFHMNQLLHFSLKQPSHGNASPLADDLGDLFLAHFFLQHRMVFLQLSELVLRGFQFLFCSGKLAIANFRNARKIA